MAKYKITERKITDYVPDSANANEGSERGLAMLEDSLAQDGAGRSIVADAHDRIPAGNKTLEAAVNTGIEDVIEVETDGRAIIVHKRRDWNLDDPQGAARRYAFRDNRVSEVSLNWNVEQILADLNAGVDLSQFWREDELAELLASIAQSDTVTADPQQARPTLSDRFVVPPFSVLDARQGYWQERKRQWLALGIQSELGRGSDIVPNGTHLDASQDGAWERGYNAAPGGSLRDAATLVDGKTVRGDGKGRIRGKLPADSGGQPMPLDRQSAGRAPVNLRSESSGVGTPGGMVSGFEFKQRGEHVVGMGEPVGRNKNLVAGDSQNAYNGGWTKRVKGEDFTGLGANSSGTSIFDPVLCELAYRWFTPPDGSILDPFAGGSVRGIVAALLGRSYTGVDLRAEQVEANEAQAGELTPDNAPRWIVGDSRNLSELTDDAYDFVFSCPPYFDLEIYSDDEQDLSNAGDYAVFIADYRAIIAQCGQRLANNRFACFVVGDIRDKAGMYRNFVSDTISAWQDAGLKLYNEAILVTAVGSLPIRVGKQFESGRKLGKTHQNVLVFIKGDPRKAVEACGTVEVVMPDMMSEYGEELIVS